MKVDAENGVPSLGVDAWRVDLAFPAQALDCAAEGGVIVPNVALLPVPSGSLSEPLPEALLVCVRNEQYALPAAAPTEIVTVPVPCVPVLSVAVTV